jgi:hypothetical protein
MLVLKYIKLEFYTLSGADVNFSSRPEARIQIQSVSEERGLRRIFGSKEKEACHGNRAV